MASKTKKALIWHEESVGDPSQLSSKERGYYETTSKALHILSLVEAGSHKVVPVVATEDMEIAFSETWFLKRRCIDDPEMADCYRSLLEAAPPIKELIGEVK